MKIISRFNYLINPTDHFPNVLSESSLNRARHVGTRAHTSHVGSVYSLPSPSAADKWSRSFSKRHLSVSIKLRAACSPQPLIYRAFISVYWSAFEIICQPIVPSLLTVATGFQERKAPIDPREFYSFVRSFIVFLDSRRSMNPFLYREGGGKVHRFRENVGSFSSGLIFNSVFSRSSYWTKGWTKSGVYFVAIIYLKIWIEKSM